MTIQNAPYQPESDARMHALETTQATNTSNITTLTTRVDGVGNGTFEVSDSDNTETVAAVGSTFSGTKLVTIINATGGGAMVLPAPSVRGQLKILNCTNAAATVTVALTNVNSTWTSLKFTGASSVILLSGQSAKWHVLDGQDQGLGLAWV